MFRRLLNATAVDGGGATAETPAAGAAVAAATPAPEVVHLTPADYRRFLAVEAELSQFKQTEAERREAAEQGRLRALAEKGQVEDAFKQAGEAHRQAIAERETALKELRDRYLGKEKSDVLGNALLGAPWASDHAGPQLKAILAASLEAVEDAAGNVVVVERSTRRPAADWVKEQLARPEYAHFLKSSTTGGAGAGGARPAGGQEGAAPSLADFGRAFQQSQTQFGSMGLGPVARG